VIDYKNDVAHVSYWLVEATKIFWKNYGNKYSVGISKSIL